MTLESAGYLGNRWGLSVFILQLSSAAGLVSGELHQHAQHEDGTGGAAAAA